MNRDDFSNLVLGQSVPIVYDRGLSSAVLDLHGNVKNFNALRSVELAGGLLLGIVGFLVAPLFALGRMRVRRETYLLGWGTVVRARIIEERQVDTGRARSTRVTYEFRDGQGTVVQGDRYLPSEGELARSPKLQAWYDSVVLNPVVLYDPRRSRSNLLYPPSSATCI